MSLYSNMLPTTTANNATYAGHGDAELGCYDTKSVARIPHLKNVKHVLLCEFRGAGPFALGWIAATFGCFIRHVFGVGAKEVMLRVTARTVIAFVKDRFLSFYRTMCPDPCDSVGIVLSSLKIRCAIAIRQNKAKPWPAGIGATRFIYSLPEFLFGNPWVVDDFWEGAFSLERPVMAFTQVASNVFAIAASFAANLASEFFGAYLGFSHGEVPSRSGQKRRSVSSGRRFVFMPQMNAGAQ